MPESEVLFSLRVAAVALALVATGCAPPEARDQVLPHDQFPPMVMHVRRPSAAWQQAVLTTEQRKDLPGEPMKWQAALDNLLWQLQGDRSAATVP